MVNLILVALFRWRMCKFCVFVEWKWSWSHIHLTSHWSIKVTLVATNMVIKICLLPTTSADLFLFVFRSNFPTFWKSYQSKLFSITNPQKLISNFVVEFPKTDRNFSLTNVLKGQNNSHENSKTLTHHCNNGLFLDARST